MLLKLNSHQVKTTEANRTKMHWVGLGWIGLDWTGLDSLVRVPALWTPLRLAMPSAASTWPFPIHRTLRDGCRLLATTAAMHKKQIAKSKFGICKILHAKEISMQMLNAQHIICSKCSNAKCSNAQ